jgi:transposase-like protein
MSESFDFNKALAALRNGQDLTGKDGIFTPLVKQLTEAALKAEAESHLETDEAPNRKNGYSKKTVKSPSGSFELETCAWRIVTQAATGSWNRPPQCFSHV